MKVSIRNYLNEICKSLSNNAISISTENDHGRTDSLKDEESVRNKLISLGYDISKPESPTMGEDIVLNQYEGEIVDIKITQFSNVTTDSSNATSSPEAIAKLLTGFKARGWRKATEQLQRTDGKVGNLWYIAICKNNPEIVIYRSIKELHYKSYKWNLTNILQINWVNEYTHGPVERTDEEFKDLFLTGLGKCFETRSRDTEFLRNYYNEKKKVE